MSDVLSLSIYLYMNQTLSNTEQTFLNTSTAYLLHSHAPTSVTSLHLFKSRFWKFDTDFVTELWLCVVVFDTPLSDNSWRRSWWTLPPHRGGVGTTLYKRFSSWSSVCFRNKRKYTIYFCKLPKLNTNVYTY